MDTATLKSLVESINKTLHTGQEQTNALLGNNELSDYTKKNELIGHLARVEVELMFVRDELAVEIDKRNRKKFYQFWK